LAKNVQEQAFAILIMLLGLTIVMGFILGGWSSILTNYYMQKAWFIHRVEIITAYLVSIETHENISLKIFTDLRKFLEIL